GRPFVLSAWHHRARTGRRGKPAIHADAATLCMATAAGVYRLPLRATEGLTRSVLRPLGAGPGAPSYKDALAPPPGFAGRVAAPSPRRAVAHGRGLGRHQSLWRGRVEGERARVLAPPDVARTPPRRGRGHGGVRGGRRHD